MNLNDLPLTAALRMTEIATARIAEDLLIQVPTLTPADTNAQARAVFTDNSHVASIPVLVDATPVGLITRDEFLSLMARPFAPELFNRKSCTHFMDARPLVVEVSLQISELSARAVDAGGKALKDGFILTRDGVYVGIGKGFDLVKALSDLQIEKNLQLTESINYARQKTIDIQTMLQNMPQGILTISAGNKVHPEYSAYLETILETGDIAGRDVMELVFKDSNLGADALSQIEAVGGACVGEDLMNFEFNEHLLVGEIEKTMPDGRKKVLDLNWSPITDDAGNIVRLMLCVRDVTELRALAAEAGKQRAELEIIGEILAVTQEKFHEFTESAIRFIDENEVIIRQHTDHDPAAVSHLFRNMHTIKGNARTYGLRHLTDTLHKAEQTYDELRKPRPDIAWDQDSLLAELADVKAAVERYARVNDVSLGRRGPGRRASIERFLMVDKEHIQDTLRRLEAVNTGNIHELLAARNAVRNVLRLLGTEPISKILDGVLSSVPSLAQELGKVAPMVDIEDNGYVLRSQIGATLKNVFTHLIRNSVDHGLETAAERQAANKPAAGTLTLHLSVDGPMLRIGLKDDGRGLALAKIHARAVESGKAEAGAKLSDESIADLVFLPGLSTASSISEVSGRGVGMDAAINFIRAEQGSIKIHFTDDAVGAPFRQFETVVYLPLRFVEHLEAPLSAEPAVTQRLITQAAAAA